MDYWIDKYGHLDLSSCYMRMGYDMFKVMNVSHEYYFAELQNLVAWDGLPIRGMNSEAKWRHLICKHGHDGPEINPIRDIELERVKLLPLIKKTISGLGDIDIYWQTNKKGNTDKIEIVVSGSDADYLVSLGYFDDHYVLRSAYHAGDAYIRKKVIPRGTLVKRIRNSA